jgi:hypothetical protein
MFLYLPGFVFFDSDGMMIRLRRTTNYFFKTNGNDTLRLKYDWTYMPLSVLSSLGGYNI